MFLSRFGKAGYPQIKRRGLWFKMTEKIVLLVAFFASMVIVGFYCRKHSTDVNGFVLGGRSVGPWLTAFSYGTSYFSAVIFVGYAGQFGWKFGIASTWIGLGNAVLGSLLAWVVLGRRTRIMTQYLDTATMPEFFGKRFESNKLKIGASIITFVFLIPYTASLYNGLSRLFGMAFNIDYTVCIVVMAVLTGIYVIAGGYMATAINDFIQGIIMIFGIIAVVAVVLSNNGGFMEALNTCPMSMTQRSPARPGLSRPSLAQTPCRCWGYYPDLPGNLGLPQIVGKFYAIKDEHSINKGMVISTFFAIIVAGGSYFLGGFGRLFSDRIDIATGGYDAIIPTMLEDLPSLLIGIVVILVLSASMSTLSSLVMASSSTLALDLIKDNLIMNLYEKKQVFTIRCLIVVFILISVIIAIVQYKSSVTFIAQLMGISWGALAGAFLAPFLYGLYWKRTTKAAVWVSFIFSTVLMICNMLFRTAFPPILQSPINAGAFAMIMGLIFVPVISLLTKAPRKRLVDDAFASYDTKVIVSVKEDLGE